MAEEKGCPVIFVSVYMMNRTTRELKKSIYGLSGVVSLGELMMSDQVRIWFRP